MTMPPGEGELPPGSGPAPTSPTLGHHFLITGVNFAPTFPMFLMDWQGAKFTELEGGFARVSTSDIRVPVTGPYLVHVTGTGTPIENPYGQTLTDSFVQIGISVNGQAPTMVDAQFDGTVWTASVEQAMDLTSGDKLAIMLAKEHSGPTMSWTCTMSGTGVDFPKGS